MAFIGNSYTLLKIGTYGSGLNQSFSKNKNVSFIKMSSENTKNKDGAKNEIESMEVPIPGKIKLSESVVIERGKNLKLLSEKWKKERITKEELERKLFGFTKNSEVLNGRMAMFFFTTGLLTELWTKQNIISQVDTMIRTLGIL